MSVLHRNLEAVEVTGCSSLDPVRESPDGIPVDDAIQSSKKSESVRDEVAFIVIRLLSVGCADAMCHVRADANYR